MGVIENALAEVGGFGPFQWISLLWIYMPCLSLGHMIIYIYKYLAKNKRHDVGSSELSFG